MKGTERRVECGVAVDVTTCVDTEAGIGRLGEGFTLSFELIGVLDMASEGELT
jgi:hypothetical protein